MPLPNPEDQLTARQRDKWIAHLTDDPTFAPYIDLPILDYPPDGLPATHPERVAALWYLDSDYSIADNASTNRDNVFAIRVIVREAGPSQEQIAEAHRVVMNLKDILTEAIWRFRRDDCSAPSALWRKANWASPSARTVRNAEKAVHVLELSWRVTATLLNRPI